MHFHKNGLVKASILSLPFALAFTLSACDDSGTSTNGENGGNASNEGDGNGATTSCDFKIDDKVWSYSYNGKDDEKITVNTEYLENKIKETEIKDIGRSCEEVVALFEEERADFPEVVSKTCDGNVITTVSEYASQTSPAQLAEKAKEAAFKAVKQLCETFNNLKDAKGPQTIGDILEDCDGALTCSEFVDDGNTEDGGDSGNSGSQEETKKGPCDFDSDATVISFVENNVEGINGTVTYEYLGDNKEYYKAVFEYSDHDCDVEESTETVDNENFTDECKRYCDGRKVVDECITTFKNGLTLKDVQDNAILVCKDVYNLE